MAKPEIIAGIALSSATIAILSGALGFAFGVEQSADDLNRFAIPLLSMVGSWVSGVGTLVAVVAALNIATRQARQEYEQDAVRCIHHTLAIVNDLHARVSSVRIMLADGGRPIFALTKNMAAIEKRYEALYERDIYRHIPGDVVDMITGMSGSFFGMSILIEGLMFKLTLEPHEAIPPDTNNSRASLAQTFLALEEKLDELFTKLVETRTNLNR